MIKVTKEAALEYHASGKPGKIEITPTKPYRTQYDLSLAYSPGVAEPCLEIQNNPNDAYKYTNKGNLVAVISNGTAVLGLGDIGAMSGKPVMEGKALLFKIYGGVDAFDIEVNEKDPDKLVEAIKAIAPSFGGINLEDIKAPECFEVERRLKEELDIPVMHDDQHGTAIISAAGLINALEVAEKKIEDVRFVISGAGAAAISCTKLYISLGANPENIFMIDSRGVITADRNDLNEQKRMFAVSRTDIRTLEDALKGADVFVGLSRGNLLTKDMVKTMADKPIIFALANPIPEISYEDAKEARPDCLIATGRSDYPNQINNVLCFPYLFRGALDTAATAINEEMKIAAVHALADLAKRPVPDIVNREYAVNDFTFGPDYFIPKPVDPRLITEISMAVAKAAIDSGVARNIITDWKGYRQRLKELMGQESKFTHTLYDTARRDPQRVVFANGANDKIITAASQALHEGICYPILLGNSKQIHDKAKKLDVSLEGIEIIDLRDEVYEEQRERYAKQLYEKQQRNGCTLDEAYDKLYTRDYFGMMMVETGDADAVITNINKKQTKIENIAKDVIGINPQFKHFGTMHLINSKHGTLLLADTLINRHPNAETLVDLALLSAHTARFFNRTPVIAMVSYSNFGSDKEEGPENMHKAVEILHEKYPDLAVDGEMQVSYALDKDLRDEKFPFNKIKGKDVNTLVFQCLNAANCTYNMIKALNPDNEVIGPIQMGLNKPVHFTDTDCSVRDIVNITAIAVIDALVEKKKLQLK